MGLIYVADPFAPTGNGPGIVYVFPQRGIDPQPIAEIRDGIERPEGLAVDADGTLYVANNGDNTIKAYRAGEMRPSKIYQIPHPYMGVDDVAVGPDRTVYASGSSRKGFIAEFPKGSTQAGLVIKMNTDAIAVDAGNNLYAVLAASPAQVYVFSPGSTRGTSLDFTMGLSYGIAIDAQHHRLDGIVVARLAQKVGRAFTADGARRLMAVENLAGRDHDPHLGIGFRLAGRLHLGIVCPGCQLTRPLDHAAWRQWE